METRDDTGKVWGERIGMIPIAHNKRGQLPWGWVGARVSLEGWALLG